MWKFLLLVTIAGPSSSLVMAQGNPLEIKLHLTERFGMDRTDEPVTFGVPIPEGRLSDTRHLLLLDWDGRPLPASFRIAQQWPDGSIRWLHVHTLITISAHQNHSLTLLQDTRQRPASTPATSASLQVEAGEDRITIVNGPVRIVLSANTPAVFESAHYSAKREFGANTQVLGGGNSRTSVQTNGQSFPTVHPGSGRVKVLEQSAMRIVVLVSGSFSRKTLDAATRSLDFEARIMVYSGSPLVLMDYTIVNRSGEVAADKVDIEDLSLALQLPLEQPTVTVGGVNSTITRTLESEVSIFQDSVDHYQIQIGDQIVEEGPGKSARTAATGWIDLSDGLRGVTIGICDFWQTWPKRIGAIALNENQSVVRLGLYPREIGRGQELYIGQARSHRIALRFHGGQIETQRLAREMASVNQPLRIVCDPDWYCLRSQAYGPIAPSGSDFGPFNQVVQHYDRIVDESMGQILTQLHDGRTSRGITVDSYGWMNWGDVFFRTARSDRGRKFEDPVKNLSWSGNYYDYGFAMLLQFMRSGDFRYLETGLRAGAYTADVFIVHYHPDPTLIGACHYCPPRYHAAIDNGEPYISRENNHAKVASVLARWQWLGDWWARQVAMEAFNNALSLRGADMKGWAQCRGNGHRLRILRLAYHFTGESKYREKAEQLTELGVEFARQNPEFDPQVRPSQRFMIGIALEGLILQYWDTRDPSILEAVKTVADHAYQKNHLERYTANMAMSFGFLWKETGEPTYLRALKEIILSSKPTDQAKLFGQTFRSTPWALGYLLDAAKKGVLVTENSP